MSYIIKRSEQSMVYKVVAKFSSEESAQKKAIKMRAADTENIYRVVDAEMYDRFGCNY